MNSSIIQLHAFVREVERTELHAFVREVERTELHAFVREVERTERGWMTPARHQSLVNHWV